MAATGAAGIVSPQFAPQLVGVQATGQVGSFGVLYWSLFNNNQDAQWAGLNNNQDAQWAGFNNDQNAQWNLVETE